MEPLKGENTKSVKEIVVSTRCMKGTMEESCGRTSCNN